MDSISPETPVTPEQVNPPPPPPIPVKPKNRLFISLVMLVTLLSLGAAAFFAYQYVQLKNQVSQTPPTPITTPSPTPNPTADWITYTNTQLEFSFQYPNDWINTPGDNLHAPDNSISMWIQTKTGGLECSVLLKSQTSIIDGKSFDIQYFSGVNSEICSNPDERTIYFGQQSPLFTITYSYNQNNQKGAEEKFDQILSTFRFVSQTNPTTGQFCGGIAGKICPEGYTCRLDGNYPDAGGSCIQTTKTKTGYTCPVNGWVDCMPGTNPKPECSTAAMDWYQANCPDFKGGAL